MTSKADIERVKAATRDVMAAIDKHGTDRAFVMTTLNAVVVAYISVLAADCAEEAIALFSKHLREGVLVFQKDQGTGRTTY
ncbi:MAG: hypothetical protein ACRECF_08635 [Methyloceanibacter sp.]